MKNILAMFLETYLFRSMVVYATLEVLGFHFDAVMITKRLENLKCSFCFTGSYS